MFVTVLHTVHDPVTFQERGHAMTSRVPAGVRVHHFLPSTDLTRAICLWEGPAVAGVSAHVDANLGDASSQDYFVVADEYALGLPTRQEVA
ncbi:MAG TPA: hypothetical protein VM324_11250 [Egibacteraceae bacterium]|jgi:hypothetical protein|nr:hypothetical protein [Egibacteraceae bacterium]